MRLTTAIFEKKEHACYKHKRLEQQAAFAGLGSEEYDRLYAEAQRWYRAACCLSGAFYRLRDYGAVHPETYHGEPGCPCATCRRRREIRSLRTEAA